MEKKTRFFGKTLLFSLISSVGFTAVGFLINLISYLTTENLFFYQKLTGGGPLSGKVKLLPEKESGLSFHLNR